MPSGFYHNDIDLALQMTQQVPVMEFGRRVALERELEKSDQTRLCNIVWDESSNFLLYGTLLGIKGEGNDTMIARIWPVSHNKLQGEQGSLPRYLLSEQILSQF